jgi:putative Ca2+/H+ antiporter (TMEM165/GDT1 family)
LDLAISSFLAVAGAIFVAELTDKDALLLLSLATRIPSYVAFIAGSLAFTITTTIIVLVGAVVVTLVPIWLVTLAGGLVMVGYGLWEARGLVGLRVVEKEEAAIEKKTGMKGFLAMVGALCLLDLAGDATEVLTIVFLTKFEVVLVFLGAVTALVAASAVETALGNTLGRFLTPDRLRVASVVVFLALGVSIVYFALT